MIRYLIKKAGYALLTLWGVVTVIFLLFTLLPGDPAQMMLGQNESEEQLQQVRKKYGFDQSVFNQYRYYLNDLSVISFHSTNPKDFSYASEEKYQSISLFKGSQNQVLLKTPYLRESFQKTGKKVTEVIRETLPNTAILAMSAIV